MPDYQNGKIYKLWSPQGNEIYIGSTINSLAKRLGGHKSKRNCRSKYLFQNYTDVRIELIQEYPCNNKMELNKREGEHIRANNCLNKEIAGRTRQEYYEDNKEKLAEKNKKWYENNKEKLAERHKEYYDSNKGKIAERHKEWREANKEKIAEYYENNKEKMKEKNKEYYEANKEKILEKNKEKIKCECGCEVSRNDIAKHRRTNKHKKIMQMQSQHQD